MPKRIPYEPFNYEVEDVAAIQCMAAGTASEEQQRRALRWIIEQSGTHDLPYRPNDRDTSFACGMQHVGKQIIRLVNADLIQFKKDLETAKTKRKT